LLGDIIPKHMVKPLKKRRSFLMKQKKGETKKSRATFKEVIAVDKEGNAVDPVNNNDGIFTRARARSRCNSDADKAISEHFSDVFVFFSDVVSFTELSASIGPQDTLLLLHDLFSRLDALTLKHGVYKVETIGDGYMAATGLGFMPEADYPTGHAGEALVNFALEAIRTCESFISRTGVHVQIRAGIHMGDAYAGVVGTRMPRYCLFGDTVNTASRMESTSTPGRLQISESVFQSLQAKNLAKARASASAADRSAQFVFQERKEVQVKGKGKLTTYFVNPTPSKRLKEVMTQQPLFDFTAPAVDS
jgi:class 3 adenylate cyclase